MMPTLELRSMLGSETPIQRQESRRGLSHNLGSILKVLKARWRFDSSSFLPFFRLPSFIAATVFNFRHHKNNIANSYTMHNDASGGFEGWQYLSK
jgi:hypothetical protein